MSALIWIHEDALRQDHPVYKQAGPGAEAFFIWDDAYFRSQGYSLKRLVFMFELLAEMDVTCLQGDSETLIRELAKGRPIYIPDSPNPEFIQIIEALKKDFDVTVVPDIPMVIVPDDVDLKRFFRYWKKARKSALTPSSDPLF